MPQISYADRTIHCKIVYFGPPASGKSTSIRTIQNQIPPQQHIALPPEIIQGVPTVSFTYRTNENVSGFTLKLTLVTFQGNEAKVSHWKQLLSHADGIVFVADAQETRASFNRNASEFLFNTLTDLNRDLLPIVFQYNKDDLLPQISPENFASEINRKNDPFLKTNALQGWNLLEVLKLLIAKLIERLWSSFQAPPRTEVGGIPGIDLALGGPSGPPVAPGGTPAPPKAPAPPRPGSMAAPPSPASPAPAPIQPSKPSAIYKASAPPAAGGPPPDTKTPPSGAPQPLLRAQAKDEKPTEKVQKKIPPPPPPPPPEPPTGMFAPPEELKESFGRRSGGKPADPYSLPPEKTKAIADDEITSLDDALFDQKADKAKKRSKSAKKKEKREAVDREAEEFLEADEDVDEAFGGEISASEAPVESLDEGGGGGVYADQLETLLSPEDIDGAAATTIVPAPKPIGKTRDLRDVPTEITFEEAVAGKIGKVGEEEAKKQAIFDKERADILEPAPEQEVSRGRRAPAPVLASARLEPASTEILALPKKNKVRNIFTTLFKVATLPVMLPVYVLLGFWKLAEKQAEIFNLQQIRRVLYLTQIFSGTITHELHERPWFEKLLSGDAGKPGPLERFVAHSRWLMWTIQKTIGTSFILLSNFLDMIIEFVASWIHSVFQAWQVSRTMAKAAKRKFSETEIQSLCDELSESRELLARLFHLSDYEIPPNTPASFPLELVLEARGLLSEMKRDLAMLTERQMAQFLKENLVDRLKAALPNPFDLVPSLKDFFILAFCMRYSRQDIEQMYIELLLSYQRMIQLKAISANVALNQIDFDLLRHEHHLMPLAHPSLTTETNLEHSIESTRKNIQRLIQALCKPDAYFSPQRWSRSDLLREVVKSSQGQKVNALFESELEAWLTTEIEKILKEKGEQTSFEEAILRKQERKTLRKLLRQQRKQNLKFIAQDSLLS